MHFSNETLTIKHLVYSKEKKNTWDVSPGLGVGLHAVTLIETIKHNIHLY